LERTFVMVKPDGVRRGLVGAVTSRFEERGLRLVGMKMVRLSRALAERHYEMHAGKPFFDELIEFITSGPAVAMVWEGPGAIGVVRAMMGPTDPQDAPAGTIRGDWALAVRENVVHGSDSAESAGREIELFFAPEEMVEAGP